MENVERKKLSDCETLLMKAIWGNGGVISLSELIEVLRTRFGKDYQRTTVATFLLRLAGKGYVESYRRGRFSYASALVEEAEYKRWLAKETVDFWFDGKVSDFLASYEEAQGLSAGEAE